MSDIKLLRSIGNRHKEHMKSKAEEIIEQIERKMMQCCEKYDNVRVIFMKPSYTYDSNKSNNIIYLNKEDCDKLYVIERLQTKYTAEGFDVQISYDRDRIIISWAE